MVPAIFEAKEIVREMLKHNILLSIDGPLKNVIKIKPPMVITKEDAIKTLDSFDKVLSKIGRKGP